MAQPPKKPSWVSWVLVPIIWAAGIALPIALVVTQFPDLGKGLHRMVVPGAQEMDLADPGDYTIFHEHLSHLGGKTYDQPEKGVSIQIKVIRKADGAEVPLSSGMSATYSFRGYAGTSVATFTVDQPGVYVIRGESDQEAVIAVGKGMMGAVFSAVGLICGAVALGIVSFVAGLVILIVAIVRSVRYGRWARANPSAGAPA